MCFGERHALDAERRRRLRDQGKRFVEADHQLPDLPPLLAVTSMPPIVIVRSRAFNMSNRVRQATETAVSASISTPVTPWQRASAATRRPGKASSGSIVT